MSADRMQAEALIAIAYNARAAKRKAEEIDGEASGGIKAYLAASGEDELVDGEHNLIAKIQERQSSGTLDLERMAEDDPALLIEIALAGALKADIKVLDGRREFAGAVRYMIAGKASVALTIKEG